jgi:hypothetical protein
MVHEITRAPLKHKSMWRDNETLVLLKWWSTRTEYMYGTHWSVSIFIWSIWDDEHAKNILTVGIFFKIFWFFTIFQLYLLCLMKIVKTLDKKKANLQNIRIIIYLKNIIFHTSISIGHRYRTASRHIIAETIYRFGLYPKHTWCITHI